jgi:hypothetical protein
MYINIESTLYITLISHQGPQKGTENPTELICCPFLEASSLVYVLGFKRTNINNG